MDDAVVTTKINLKLAFHTFFGSIGEVKRVIHPGKPEKAGQNREGQARRETRDGKPKARRHTEGWKKLDEVVRQISPSRTHPQKRSEHPKTDEFFLQSIFLGNVA